MSEEQVFLKELEEAYTSQEADAEFKEEVAVWDVTIADGLTHKYTP